MKVDEKELLELRKTMGVYSAKREAEKRAALRAVENFKEVLVWLIETN